MDQAWIKMEGTPATDTVKQGKEPPNNKDEDDSNTTKSVA